jgi:hypothetical protein
MCDTAAFYRIFIFGLRTVVVCRYDEHVFPVPVGNFGGVGVHCGIFAQYHGGFSLCERKAFGYFKSNDVSGNGGSKHRFALFQTECSDVTVFPRKRVLFFFVAGGKGKYACQQQ